MSIEPMAKIRAVGSASEEEAFLKKIQSLGIIQIEDDVSRKVREDLGSYEINGGAEKETDRILSEIKQAEDFLEKYSVPKTFLESVLGEKLVLKTKDLLKTVGDFDYRSVVDKAKNLDAALTELKEREEKTAENLGLFRSWSELDYPVEEIRDGSYFEMSAGWIPSKFENPDISPGICSVVQKTAKSSSVVVLWLKEDKEQASKMLKELEFEKTDFAGFTGKPSEIIDKLEKTLHDSENEKTSLYDESKKLVSQIESLRIVHDYYNNVSSLKNTAQKLFHTRHAFVLEGWIKKSDKEKLFSLQPQYSSISLEEISFEENENPPVALKNRKLFKPFELVIQLYGMPSS
ncbi:hypothetical protein JW890_02200, partial [candidate division WOR-3 bacterium]|nr:hypothetical protein [candidate division WOR-3 bacterium]